MDNSGPCRNGAHFDAKIHGACIIPAMMAQSFHQPDGRFPILRIGSQHADDSMRNECWGDSSVPVEISGVFLYNCRAWGVKWLLLSSSHGEAATTQMLSSCSCGALFRYR
jgi:hypothetical protein